MHGCLIQIIGGSKGGGGSARDAHPPLGPNSFTFMQFSGKNWSNKNLMPPPWRLAPHPSEKSWIATANGI